MMIMSLRDGGFSSKQSPVSRGDCLPYGYDVATCARNDMHGDALPLAALGGFVRQLQSAGGEGLRPFVGRTQTPSMLDE